MKRITALIISVILILSFLPSVSFASSTDMRGVWVSTVTNLDFPSAKGLSADEQKKELTDMFDNFKNMGINTIIFQVRPCGDALYKSSINPWSQYLTGVQGQDPGYDPLEFAVSEAHKRGMELHAWLNPYRVTMKGNTDINTLAANNPARLHPDWLINYNDTLTFNPAKQEVIDLICDTVKEIVTNYDVDAIHFDDYFYPSGYPLSEGEGQDGNEANQRRENVNNMVKAVSGTINAYAPDVEFGISPMGIWKDAEVDGYQIKGSSSYYTVFGDSVTWIKNGWIDYIVPQIYWEDSHATASYSKLVKWWNNTVQGTGVKLYIGEGIYKEAIAKEITSHFEIDKNYNNVQGNIFFRAGMLLDNFNAVGDAVKNYYSSLGNSQTNQNTNNGSTNQNTENSTEQNNNVVIERIQALPTSSNIKVDGTDTIFESYNIDGYNYFKLRDIACALSGTEKQFDTLWDSEKEVITIDMGKPYTVAGGELTKGNGSAKEAVTSTAKVYINGSEVNVEAYNIDGMNYYKLRDIAKAVDFGVAWSEELNSIGIFSIAGYSE